MTRFSGKIRFSFLVVKPTRFLSLLSLSTFRLCNSFARSLLSKTLSFFTMDTFFNDRDDLFWDLDSRPQRRFSRDQDPQFDNEPLYLVSYRSLSLSNEFVILIFFLILEGGLNFDFVSVLLIETWLAWIIVH